MNLERIINTDIEFIDGDRGQNYPSKSDFFENGYCVFLNTGNITKNGFNFSKLDFITEEKDKSLRKGKVKIDDVILTTRGTVGNVALVTEKIKYPNMRINSGMVIIRSKKDFTPLFLNTFFRSELFKKQASTNGSGSAQPQLPISALKNISIPKLDKKTQAKITSVLSALDEKIALNNETNATLEQMAKTLYDYWFVQFDFPDDNGKPYKSSGGEMVYNDILKREIPKGWDLGSVKDYCPSTAGYAFKSSEWTVTGNPVIKIKNIQDNQTLDVKDIDFVNLTNRKIDNKFKAEAGNIVIAMTGATIGKFALVPKAEIDFYINQRVGYFDLGENPVARLPFLINSLNMDYFRDSIFTLASGAAQPNISNAQINDIILLTPPNELIKRFNSMVSANYESILNNQFTNQKLAELRDWLLPMLMNGQATVQ